MNTTIAVALITALATIAGASIAGVISYVMQRQQTNAQEEARRRQLRRDAYVDLLAKYDATVSILDQIWDIPLNAHEFSAKTGAWSRLEDCILAWNVAVNVVNIEGPENISGAAGDIADYLNNEYSKIEQCASKHSGETKKLIGVSGSSFAELYKERGKVKWQFINEVSKVLG